MSDDKIARCELCGELMPAGEEMFKYHGYSGPCPKPPLPKSPTPRTDEELEVRGYVANLITYVPADYARQLERELAATCEERDRYKADSIACQAREAELRELLGEAEHMLHHTECMTNDAMKCAACSLESRIGTAISHSTGSKIMAGGWFDVSKALPPMGEDVIVTDGVAIWQSRIATSGIWSSYESGVGEPIRWKPVRALEAKHE